MSETKYEILAGTPYSKFAIPLDYPPSRQLRPRWGVTQPMIQPIADWIAPENDSYQEILSAMSLHSSSLQKIARHFQHDMLPEPAWFGVPYSPFDAAALYAIIGLYKPKLYLEIGSGITTAFAWKAIKGQGLDTKIVSIDPEPRAAIDNICDEVIRSGLELCDLTIFDRLEAGDILFFDGSHRVFMNSDVTVFMIDILPRLKPGVIIHIHDIALPWDYDKMFTDWYWSEAYILAAYLIGARDRAKPIFPTTWVCRQPEFNAWFASPPVDFGADNDAWRGGGAMWFTHK